MIEAPRLRSGSATCTALDRADEVGKSINIAPRPPASEGCPSAFATPACATTTSSLLNSLMPLFDRGPQGVGVVTSASAVMIRRPSFDQTRGLLEIPRGGHGVPMSRCSAEVDGDDVGALLPDVRRG